MALLELGAYRRSIQALSAAGLVFEAEAELGGDPETGRPPWRPAAHERVLMTTLRVVDDLALQDLATAAEAADRTVDQLGTVECSTCDWLFSRVVAAIAYDGAGRWRDGLAILDGVTATGPAGEVVDALRMDLAQAAAGHQPAGLAPPPVETRRELVVLLLLGHGPGRERVTLEVDGQRKVRSTVAAPWGVQSTAAAALELADTDVRVQSVALTDVDAAAEASLRERNQRMIAAGTTGLDGNADDLRHWASLPASLALIRADVPDGVDRADLVILAPDGDEVDRETLVWPDAWTGGRLFVVRRVP
jgi:hypothetical protein